MENTAKVLRFPDAEARQRLPDSFGRVQGDGRAIAVAKFRELADKLESGELDGARVQWGTNPGLDTVTEMQTVTLSATEVQLITTKIEEV